MKTKNFLLLVLLFFIGFAGKLRSQNTFKTIIISPWNGSSGTCIISLDTMYLFGDYGSNSILRGFSLNGILEYTQYFSSNSGGPGAYGPKSFFVRDAGNLIMPLVGIDSAYRICLTSFNLQTNSFNWISGLNIGNSNTYGNPRLTLNKGMNKSYSISTYKWHSIPNLQVWPIVVTTDSIGNLIQSYRIENHFGIALFSHQVSNESYITGINYRDTLGATLVRYDTSGTVIWAKTFFAKGSIFHSAVNNNDGTLTLIGAIDTSSSPSKNQLFFMKIDTSGSVLWCKSMGDSARAFRHGRDSQVKPTSDGGYIITGYACGSNANINYQSDLILIKTDANGDTLWTRCHGHPYTEDGGDDIEQTPDGGYIMTGFSNSAQFLPDAYAGYIVFKTDSLGMTDTHCQEFSMPMAITNITPPDSNIALTITTGLINAVPSSVTHKTDSMGQENGCYLSPVGIDEPNGSNLIKLFAVPNPSTGIITIKGGSQTPDSKSLIVYDIMGHEILRKDNIIELESTIDLSKYASGVYFIKIIREGDFEFCKVVKE